MATPPRYGYVVLAPFVVTDAGWVTLYAPVPADGFRLWSVEGDLVIGDKDDVTYQDTLLAGEIEDCTVPARGHAAGPIFHIHERVIDLRAVLGSIQVKARIYGPRA